jgi:DNA polymerase I-like protein with 3'-5' exonuclease and polymerase domains
MDVSKDEAKDVLRQFNKSVPFLKALNEGVQRRLNDPRSSGAIRSLKGRKCRFNLWEPDGFESHKAMSLDEALAAHGPTTRLRRAYTYKALNRLIQASAADMTKAAWLACYEAGYTPMLQVHDELAFSVKDREEAVGISNIMNQALPLVVPSKCDVEIGDSWGDAK